MNKIKLMTSYMVYRELFKNNRKDHYEILSLFIEHLINNNKLDVKFSDVDIKELLFNEFGFDIPVSAIKISLSRISKNNLIKKVSKSEYNVIRPLNEQNEIFDKNAVEVKDLINRIKAETNSNLTEDEIVEELYNILIDDESKSRIDNKILMFLYNNKYDEQIQRVLSEFKEGFLLSTGVTYNIISKGYIKNELIIFLSTEILLFLMGYSGEYKNNIAKDFIKNLKDIDKDCKIKLKYFSDTKKEIEGFFLIAQDVFMNRRQIDPTKEIVRSILNGVKCLEDIIIKQSDLFYNLNKKYGITEDVYDKYYSQENDKYNLEGVKINIDGYMTDIEQSQKFISNINKIRKSKPKDIFDARAVYVTNKGITLEIDKVLCKEINENNSTYVFPNCLSLSNITNIFWCSNPKTLLSCKPYNVDVVANISLALQDVIGFKAEKEYEAIKKEYEVDNDEEKYKQRLQLLSDMTYVSTELSEDTNKEKVIFTIENLNRPTDMFFEEIKKLRIENEELKRKIEEKNNLESKDMFADAIDKKYVIMKESKREAIEKIVGNIRKNIIGFMKQHWKKIILVAILIGLYYLNKNGKMSSEIFDLLNFIK